MLVKSRYFNGMNVEALDGMAGKVIGMLMDLSTWKVRYIVVQNRDILTKKKFIISTFNISKINYSKNLMKLDLTLTGISEEPFLEKSEGIGIQVQKNFFDISGWKYLEKMFSVGWLTGPFGVLWQTKGFEHNKRSTGMHLQTTSLIDAFNLLGMSISCKDRDFGVIKSLMIDPLTWECRFIEIRKVKWLPSDSTVLPIQIVNNVDWKRRLIDVETHEKKILEAPYYNHRIFSTLSERLFNQYYNVEQTEQLIDLERDSNKKQDNRSIA